MLWTEDAFVILVEGIYHPVVWGTGQGTGEVLVRIVLFAGPFLSPTNKNSIAQGTEAGTWFMFWMMRS